MSPLSAKWNTAEAAPPPPTGPAVPPTAGSITAVPATQPPHGDSSVGEVVVTARKFTERLLDAPLTATVLDSAAIQARDITTLADVANYTPAVTLTNQGGARVDRSSQTIIIRGMNPQSSQTASVFIDGAAIPGGFVEGIDDVQRVEVLKGPQSTAFGREAFAGAIDIVTKDPSDTLGGRVDILSATDDTIDARGMIEGPLIKDVLSFRISPRYYSEEGQYTNHGTGPGRLGDQSTRSVNGSLLFTPASGVKVKYFGQYYINEDGPQPVGEFGPSDYNCNAGAAPAGTLNYICGVTPHFPTQRLGVNEIVDPLFTNEILHNSTGALNPLYPDGLGLHHGGLLFEAYHQQVNADYEIPALDVLVSALASIDDQKSSVITDLDLTNTVGLTNPNFGVKPGVEPYINSLYNFQSRNNGEDAELRFQSLRPGRFRWLIGANYVFANAQSVSSALLPTGVSNQLNGNPTRTNTYGVFGSLAYDVLHNLNISFEGRYQIDDVALYARGANDGPILPNLDSSFKNFVPRVIANYAVTPKIHAYASFSQGVNPGTFNAQFPSLAPSQLQTIENTYHATTEVQPEKLTNYEIGAKGRFLDNKLQAALSFYYAIWTNQIVQQSIPLQQVNAQGQPTGALTTISASTNIGETKLDGVELDGSYRPIRPLTFSFSGAVAATDIRDFYCATCGQQTGNFSVTGNQLPRYSKYTGQFAADYRDSFPFIKDAEYYGRVDYIYKSGAYDSPADIVRTPDSNVVNLRGGISTPKYRFEGFVTNLTNDTAFISIENQVYVLSPTHRDLNVELPQLRKFGVRVSYSF